MNRIINELAKSCTIKPLNEGALLISLGNSIDVGINLFIIELHRRIIAVPFPGLIESVPAYSSLAVYFDTGVVKGIQPNYETAFDVVREHLENILRKIVLADDDTKNQVIEIPVLYDGEDLGFVADRHFLTHEEVIAIHVSVTYRVFMIGFLPGFAYMGSVNKRISTPRRSSPRTFVPGGSVGIAGTQTGIYPQSSPGGWQLIGRTPLRIFDKEKSSPCLLNPGDRVRYYPIDLIEFEKRNEY